MMHHSVFIIGDVAVDSASDSPSISCGFEPHQRRPLFLEQGAGPSCLVLVGSRNGFKYDFTIKYYSDISPLKLHWEKWWWFQFILYGLFTRTVNTETLG